MAGELPEDALEAIMIAEAMGNEVQNRNMPGAMPERVVLFADFTDEEDEVDGNAEAPARGDAAAHAQDAGNAQQVPVDVEGSSGEDEDEESEEEEVAVSLFFPAVPRSQC
jgi:hypothetical protein